MMKLLIALAFALLAGCEYTVPLTTTPEIEIDRSILGLWRRSTEDGRTEQLLVLPLDKHEYLVSYPSGAKDAMFARACLCRAADMTLVQLKWFGTAEAILPGDDRVFQFMNYSIDGDRLTVRLLNSQIANKNAASTEELAKSIVANRDKPTLFKDSMVFRKVNSP